MSRQERVIYSGLFKLVALRLLAGSPSGQAPTGAGMEQFNGIFMYQLLLTGTL